MAFTSEQKIGKYIYVYEANNYWDKEKKQSRQKRTYLGRKNPETGEIIPTQKDPVPRSFRDYGNVYLLRVLAEQIGLVDCLKQVYGDLWKQILTCVLYEISEAKPLYLCRLWTELSFSEGLHAGLGSQRISELLREIGEQSQRRLDFFKAWIQLQEQTKSIYYDITSLSSYAKAIELIEWGYNRDKEKLPQLNLGVIFGEPLSLPLFYTVHQGSIPDVVTLENTSTLAKTFGLKGVSFIMDKGFYSNYNLGRIAAGSMRFLIPYPERNKGWTGLINKHLKDLTSPSHAIRVDKNILFGLKDKTQVGNKSYNAFVYFDEKKKAEQSTKFYKELLEIEEKLSEAGFKEKEEVENYLPDQFKKWKKYLGVVKTADRYAIRRKHKAINEAVDRMGKLVLLSNYRIGVKEAIRLYRNKDEIEKFFDNMKNDLSCNRLRVHTTEAAQGRIFLSYISLILYSWINKKMRQGKLFKDYTVQEVMYELKKIKHVQLAKKKNFITELSKKQKEIFKRFGIDLPKVAY